MTQFVQENILPTETENRDTSPYKLLIFTITDFVLI